MPTSVWKGKTFKRESNSRFGVRTFSFMNQKIRLHYSDGHTTDVVYADIEQLGDRKIRFRSRFGEGTANGTRIGLSGKEFKKKCYICRQNSDGTKMFVKIKIWYTDGTIRNEDWSHKALEYTEYDGY